MKINYNRLLLLLLFFIPVFAHANPIPPKGRFDSPVSYVRIVSNNAYPDIANIGDVVTVYILTFPGTPINAPTVTINGHSVTATIAGANTWAASYTIAFGDPGGDVRFSIDYTDVAGTTYPAITSTTDGSAVTYATYIDLRPSGINPIFTLGSSPVGLDGGITVASDGKLTFAAVSIISVVPGDVLYYTAGNNISGSYNSAIGTLTLTSNLGRMTPADIQAAFRSIAFSTNSTATGTRNIYFKVNNDAISYIAAISVTVVAPPNHAPVLAAASPSLGTILSTQTDLPGPGKGVLISNIVNTTGIANFSDADSGTQPGAAITGVDNTKGTWWYTNNNGTDWTAIGSVSNTSALLLKADANTRLYFQVTGGAAVTGTLANAITFRAWDQSTGSAGSKVSTATNGGTTAFSSATNTATLTIAAPVQTLTALAPTNALTTNASTVNYKATFSGAVNGLSASNFSLSGSGATGALTGTPTTTDGIAWNIPVTTGADGTLLLTFANAAGLTPNVNNAPVAGNSAYTIDKTAPGVSFLTTPPSLTISTNASFSFTGNDGAGSGVSSYAGSLDGSPYTTATSPFSLTGLAQGAHTLSISAKDAAGNTGLPATYNWTVDNTGPVVTSVTVPANATYKAGQVLSFTVNFNETVNVTGTPYLGITLDTGGMVQAAYVSGTGTPVLTFAYTVVPGNADRNGIALNSLSLNNGSINDAAGNVATLNLNNAGSTTGVLVDAVPPVISSITATAANPGYGGNMPYTITFSEPVTGVDVSDFTLTTTGSVRANGVAFTPVSQTVYTVTASGVAGNGTLRLDLNGSGTGITDLAGNAITGGFTAGSVYTTSNPPSLITFNTLPSKTYGDADFAPGAISSNTITAITYSSDNPAVATIVNGQIHIVGAGTAHIMAAQAAGGNYNAATSVNQILNISKAAITVTADAGTKTYGQADPLFTYKITAGVLIGTDAFTGNLTRAAGENVGSYGIGQGTLALSDNYILTYTGADLTITPAIPVITFNALPAKTYGDADDALTATSSNPAPSLAYTSSNTAVATIINGSIHIGGAGSTTITATQTAGGNYNAAVNVTQVLTVNKANITVTADAQTKVYGRSDPALTYQITSGALVGADAFTGSLSREAGENTGTYAIKQGTLALNSNYTLTYTGAGLTISPAAIAVTADTQHKVYGDADPVLTYKVTSGTLIGSDAFTGSLARAAGENIGTYTINQGSLELNTNYALTYAGANLTITPAAITVAVDAQTKVYGQTDPALTYKITSGALAGSDAFTGSLARAAGENIGNYAINQGSLALNTNYSLTYAGANLTITPAAITVTADARTKSFGEPDPLLTYAITSGALQFSDTFTGALGRLPGESIGNYAIKQGTLALNSNYNLTYAGADLSIRTASASLILSDLNQTYDGQPKPVTVTTAPSGLGVIAVTYNGSATAPTAAGSYLVNAQLTNSNYTAPDATGSLVIGKADEVITFNALSNKTYGDADVVLSATSTNTGIPVTYTSSNTSVATIVDGSIHIVGAGNTTITALQAGDANHYAAATVTQTLTVAPAAIVVAADKQTKIYGQADPALTYKVTSGGLAGSDAFSGSLTRAIGENTGTYTITQGTLALGNNYTLTYQGADLTIAPAAITVTADAQTKVYGQADPALTYKITSGALTGSDAFIGSLARAAGEQTGTYTINQGTLALNTNYALTYAGANLTITPAAITVAVDAQTKVYGQTDPALTYKITSGALVGSDAFIGSLARAAGEHTGTYAINQGTLALSNNYILTYQGGDLTIAPAAITVTADAQTKVYGQVDPALTYKITSGGLVGSDAFSGSLVRLAGEHTGTYTINQGTLTLSSDYTLSYADAELTITPVTITLTADAQTKIYGQNDPVLTYKVTSGALVGSDAFSGTLTRVAGETAGTYTINRGTLALTSNYSLNYVGADLKIASAPLTITAVNQTKVFGTANPVLTASYAGFVNGDDAGSLTMQPTLGTPATVSSPLGNYPITVSGAAAANYSITYAGGTLTVTRATLTITAGNQTRVYGEPNPAPIVTFSGFVNGDSQASLTAQPVIGTTASVSSSAGNYPVTVSGAAIANYNIIYIPGSLTITKAALTIIADNQSRNYGAANPALTVTCSGFVNGDDISNITQPVVTTAATATSAPGNYAIKASGAVSANYSFKYVDGILTIRPLSNASLNNLFVSDGALSPAFSTGTHEYKVTVDNSVSQEVLTAGFDPTATATVNGVFTSNNGASSPVPLNVGNNTLTILITAQDGVTTAIYRLTVYRGEPLADITATNILTPNGDGKNDTWVVKDIELYPDNRVTVYDRGGRIIFTQHNYQNNWTGTVNGQPLQEGTYYYLVELGMRSIKGYITILRSR